MINEFIRIRLRINTGRKHHRIDSSIRLVFDNVVEVISKDSHADSHADFHAGLTAGTLKKDIPAPADELNRHHGCDAFNDFPVH